MWTSVSIGQDMGGVYCWVVPVCMYSVYPGLRGNPSRVFYAEWGRRKLLQSCINMVGTYYTNIIENITLSYTLMFKPIPNKRI